MLTSWYSHSAGWRAFNSSCPLHPRRNAVRGSRSSGAQPERVVRVASEAEEGHASSQADSQLQSSPRVLRRQNAMRRRQAHLSSQQQPPQQLSQGELDNSQSVQLQQRQDGTQVSAGQWRQQQQQQHQRSQRRQAGGGVLSKGVSSKPSLRGPAAAAAAAAAAAGQGPQKGREGSKTASQARAEELGAPRGSALAARLSQLLEQEAQDDESESEASDEEVFGEDEVERLVFGNTDFSIAPQPQGQPPHKATDSSKHDLEACRAALLQPSTAMNATITTNDTTLAPPNDSAHSSTSTSTVSAPAYSAAVPAGMQTLQQVSPIPTAVAGMVLAAAEGGFVAAVPESLLMRTRHLMGVAGWQEERVLQAVQRLREEVGSVGGQTITAEEAMAALLLVPNLISLNEQDIRTRMTALLNPGLVGKGTTMKSLTPLVLSHPELLVAPLNALQSKLTTFRNLMGLTGEAAVAMLNPYMFEGCP